MGLAMPAEPPTPRFFADAMLGGLVRWLRILDLDVAYDPELDDPELVERAVAEGRTILTRDRKLTERRAARNHLLIASGRVEEQVQQVLETFGVRPDLQRLLGRCLVCNLALEPLAAELARQRVPPYVARTQEDFRACPGCERIYWRGTHVARMAVKLARMGLVVT
jgi:uncharacterized protein with PIN domain